VSETYSDCRFVWYQNTAVHHLVLSQYTHLTDGQTVERTELRQQYRALHYMPHSKTRFCVPTDELLQTKYDLLSEGGQSL